MYPNDSKVRITQSGWGCTEKYVGTVATVIEGKYRCYLEGNECSYVLRMHDGVIRRNMWSEALEKVDVSIESFIPLLEHLMEGGEIHFKDYGKSSINNRQTDLAHAAYHLRTVLKQLPEHYKIIPKKTKQQKEIELIEQQMRELSDKQSSLADRLSNLKKENMND